MESGLNQAIQYIGGIVAASVVALIGLLAKRFWKGLSEDRKAQVKAALKFWKKLRGGK